MPLTDDFLNLRPRLSAVVFIRCRQDALVLLRLAQEVFGALLRSLAGQDVDLPVLKRFRLRRLMD